MDIFCQDDQLNLSSYYLKPGFAFGGSCLPKDVRAIQYRAKELDVELPVISAILPSNKLQVATAFEQIMETGKSNIGLLGFSFKAGTDDLRESPLVTLAEQLLGKGLKLKIYDKNVLLARLVGANKDYIDERIPHLSSLLCESIHDVVSQSDVLIVGNKSSEFSEALHHTRPDQVVIDLVRVPVDSTRVQAEYRGICW
jgi:GDP-mannose 6-dehydrogenase